MIVRDKMGVLERLLKQYERYYTINRKIRLNPLRQKQSFPFTERNISS